MSQASSFLVANPQVAAALFQEGFTLIDRLVVARSGKSIDQHSPTDLLAILQSINIQPVDELWRQGSTAAVMPVLKANEPGIG